MSHQFHQISAPCLITRRSLLRATALGSTAAFAAVMLPSFGSRAQSAGNHINPLAIPPQNEGRSDNGTMVFDLELQRGTSTFFDQIKTPTLGINGSFLGPTLRMRAGNKVRLNVKNSIGGTSTLHWHGMHLPAKMDGGPHQTIDHGTTWSPEFGVKQKAATVWYHSHQLHGTASQVWQGLAGMIIIDDEESDTLHLPRDDGVDDVPIVLQDRRFSLDGRMDYEASRHDTMLGMIGNISMTNGTVAPYFEAKSRLIRLRILNGSNASIYNLGFNDDRSFLQVASDGGFLEAPFKTNHLVLAPGERAEIVVDAGGGNNFMLSSRASSPGMGMMRGGRGMMGGMMGGGSPAFDFLEIRPAQTLNESAEVPSKLADIDWIQPQTAAKTRQFVMNMTMGPMMMMGFGNSHTINDKAMKMSRVDEVVKLGDTEIWEIGNNSPLPHPFHIHNVQFQILNRNGHAPHAGERGRKDTVLVNPGEIVRIIAKFEDYADSDKPFMYHCHILEHEDAGMMGQFTVV